MNRIKAEDLAEKLSEECFNDDDKTILEYKLGKRDIPISKQFLHFYKGYTCRYQTKEEFYDNFSIVLEDTRDILAQLKLLQEQRDKILNPEYFRAKTVSTGKTLTNNKSVGNTNNTNNFKGNYLDFNATHNVDERLAINVVKDGSTQTSKLYNVEEDWINNSMRKPEIGAVTKKSIAMNENNEIVISEEVTPKQEQTNVTSKPPVNTYNNITFNRTDGASNVQIYSQTEGGSKTRNVSEFTGLDTNTTDGTQTSDVTTSTFIEGETILTSINKRIPALRYDFWRSFLGLFYV